VSHANHEVPTPVELRRFLREHLSYEVEMLRGTAEKLLAIVLHDQAVGKKDYAFADLTLRNALLESFTVYARALLDFLYPPPNARDDDALATHYVEDWAPPEFQPPLDLLRGRVGKEIAHLTYGRLSVSETDKGWYFPAIWHQLASVIDDFASRVPSELGEPLVTRRLRELASSDLQPRL